MNAVKRALDWKIIWAFAAVYILWGSTYLGIYYAIQTWPPFILGGTRFLVVGITIYLYTYLIKKERYEKDLWRFGLISGFLLFFIGNGAIIIAENYVPSGLVSIIASTVPFWILVLDHRSGKSRFNNILTWVGLGLGFFGVVLLFAGRTKVTGMDPRVMWSYALLSFGTVCWTYGTLYSKYHPVPGSTLAKVCVQMTTAGMVFLLVAVFRGEFSTFSFRQIDTSSWIAIWYLILFGSLIGYFCYMWLLTRVSSNALSTYAYVNPVVAVILGNLIAGEKIDALEYLALVLILGGLLLIYGSKKRVYTFNGFKKSLFR